MLYRSFFTCLFLLALNNLNAQSFNQDKIALTNFLTRMYDNEPYEGVKLFEDYDHTYLLSVIKLNNSNYTNSSSLNRVAQVKSRQQASVFFNGSEISSDIIIKYDVTKKGLSIVEYTEIIHEQSIGFVDSMELLTNFTPGNSKDIVFIFIKELVLPANEIKKPKKK
jgi:hypothetical protein